MIRLVVFDMAGTTLQDDDAVNTCLGEALKNGGRWLKRDVINEVMGMPKRRAIELLLEPIAAGIDARFPGRDHVFSGVGTNAGCRLVVGYTGGTHTRDQLAAAPHTHLIADLRELLPIAGIQRGKHVRAL
jgi:beta-phosphoglucomutase-like phosphatase (HAD superfamily)